MKKINPCKKCGSIDIKFRDCGYSSFNCGTAKCKCGFELSFNNLSCFGAVEYIQKQWNIINSLKFVDSEIEKLKEEIKILNKEKKIIIKHAQ